MSSEEGTGGGAELLANLINQLGRVAYEVQTAISPAFGEGRPAAVLIMDHTGCVIGAGPGAQSIFDAMFESDMNPYKPKSSGSEPELVN
jgi:hypothetical protein